MGEWVVAWYGWLSQFAQRPILVDHRGVSIAAGGIFVLAGLHDTFVYWWL